MNSEVAWNCAPEKGRNQPVLRGLPGKGQVTKMPGQARQAEYGEPKNGAISSDVQRSKELIAHSSSHFQDTVLHTTTIRTDY